jgi:transcriptional regulator with XRE-family HTH domain
MILVAPTALGNRLRQLRQAAGLTQQALAFKSGLSITNIIHIERGRIPNPRLFTMKAIALALGCKVDDFFHAEDAPKTPRKRRGKDNDKG